MDDMRKIIFYGCCDWAETFAESALTIRAANPKSHPLVDSRAVKLRIYLSTNAYRTARNQ
jgi:hypothetical protein